MLKTGMQFLRKALIGTFIICIGGAAQASDIGLQAPHDFMIDNSPLRASELTEAFSGRTHSGFYRFEREAFPTHRFEETTAKDGSVEHLQGAETLTGKWSLKGDQICYVYDEIWARQLCFDIYRVGNCYYHYLQTEGGRPIKAWTARSSFKGERPNCEPNIA